jgi:hypothetical protein
LEVPWRMVMLSVITFRTYRRKTMRPVSTTPLWKIMAAL